jgi:aryl-alcohol dehydrogenase-like predicted oxidoreductase
MTDHGIKQPSVDARRLGNTDIVVNRLGYGAMELTGAPRARAIDEGEALRFLNEVVDLGISYIDTSIDYGLSETLIGKALSHRRNDFALASKCACQVGVEGVGEAHEKHIYTSENVTAGVEQSLRRLKTDRLDVVQVHGNPTRKQLEEGGVIEALLRLRREGKVRWLGLSSRLPLLAEFVDADYLDVVQVPYSALQRTNETLIASLKKAGKAIVARGVTGRGAPAKQWHTRPIGTADGEVRDLWERARIDELLGDLSPMEFMIRFALSNDDIDVALVATTNPDHLAADLAFANRGRLPPETYRAACARLDAAGGGAGQGNYRGGGPTPIL